jgi:DNA repair protein RadC
MQPHPPGPRERLVNAGVEALSDAELVALLLGTGSAAEPVQVVAARLLEDRGGLAGLAHAGVGELASQLGVGFAKGARLLAAVELGRRVAHHAARTDGLRFPDSRAVDAWARPRLASLDHEELWVLVLDGQNGLRAARRVATGGLHGLHVGVRDPLRIALREGASAILLVHNHPSGDPSPSTEDVEFTRRMTEAADVAATPLLDHVVVARGGFASMLDRGLLPAVHRREATSRPLRGASLPSRDENRASRAPNSTDAAPSSSRA